jgi:hypothetical protein
MYQLVVTVRELDDGYRVSSQLSEVLPGGGVATVRHSHPREYAPKMWAVSNPLVRILQILAAYAQMELADLGQIDTTQPLF